MPKRFNINTVVDEYLNLDDHLATAQDSKRVNDYYNCGNTLQNQGHFKQAIGLYRKAIEHNPFFVNAYNNMGLALGRIGLNQEAAECFLEIIRLQPNFAQAYNNLGNIYCNLGFKEKAIACYRRAVELKEGFSHAYYNLGNAYELQGNIEKAAACLARAQVLLPDDPLINFGFGLILQKQGNYCLGLKYLEAVQKLKPEFLTARLQYLLSLPVLYSQESQIIACRKRFEKGLDELVFNTGLETVSQKRAALEAIGQFTNFYLPYQGQNDLALQKKFGEFSCLVMASCYPEYAKSLPMPARKIDEKIRVGFISAYMHSHTVAKLFLGWIKNLNGDDFEVYCYYLKSKFDDVTESFKKQSNFFCQLNGDLESATRRITTDDLHILVYLDIGMFALASQLAGLRLAPVQCAAWGHPITTGFPTMDYFLSSELMEPANGKYHYSEKLVRLPNLSISYEPPSLPEMPKTRQQFGIGQKAFVYLSPQSIFKYLPQHDFLFPKIAREVSNAKFVFISNASRTVTRVFKKRLERAFEKFKLKARDYCDFLPRLGRNDYLSLNLAADVMLDTLEWSGGKTTLEAVCCNLPIISQPGQFMRGRHSYAILKILSLNELIAANNTEYIQTAIRMAKDREFYLKIKQRMRLNKNEVFNDLTAINALEAFFGSLVPVNFGNTKQEKTAYE
jgi:predicted O-linked N-acetylglucosamine transferase (SPINDLY family)